MQFIDTHCHLYLPEFKDDLKEVMQRAADVHVEKFFMPAIDSSHANDLLNVQLMYADKCFAMMGLHPCSVKNNYKDELDIVEKNLEINRYAAVGEIGLDFYWDTTYAKEQNEIFKAQMQLALNKNLPVVIHTRNAMQQTIESVKPFADKGLRGIFHCFGESYETAMQIINMGFYLGIGGVLTYKKSGLYEVLKKIDLNNIVLETDAPYLTPVPFRGKRNESSYIKIIAEKLAEAKQVTIDEVAAITTANAEIIFNISK